MQVEFLGATGTVTGSKYLVNSSERQLLDLRCLQRQVRAVVQARLLEAMKEPAIDGWPCEVPEHRQSVVVV
jgi:hypothetical protein